MKNVKMKTYFTIQQIQIHFAYAPNYCLTESQRKRKNRKTEYLIKRRNGMRLFLHYYLLFINTQQSFIKNNFHFYA